MGSNNLGHIPTGKALERVNMLCEKYTRFELAVLLVKAEAMHMISIAKKEADDV